MGKKKVIFIIGSARKDSFNRQLANQVEGIISEKADVIYIESSSVPYMDQDIEFPAPESVVEARKIIGSADGIWIFTPEYNHSVPGVLKNFLDWMSRPLDPEDPDRKSILVGKKVTVSGVSGASKTTFVRPVLVDMLKFVRMDVLCDKGTGFGFNREMMTSGKWISDEESEMILREHTEKFLSGI